MDNRTRDALLHALLETFFAILPLGVLLFCWRANESHHPIRFTQLPEISLIAIVLYGLTLSKYIQGFLGRGNRSEAVVITLALFPVLGVIVSVLLAVKVSLVAFGIFTEILQVANLALAILMMFLIGGYGMSRSHRKGHL